MFPFACPSAVRHIAASQPILTLRSGLNGWLLAAAATLIVCILSGLPLAAQTAHYGAIVNVGSGFSTPTGVSVDAYGNVFVADFGNSAIKEILAVNGTIPASPVINTLGSGFANPFTAAVDASGNVYVADYGHKQVKEIEAVNGSIPASPTIRVLGAGFSFIFGTAVDGKGDAFITDYGHNSVKELVAVGGVMPPDPKILVLGSGFNIPAGLAVDGNGNVFVGDQNNNAVKEILASSGYTTTITVATGFSTPDGVAIDQYGDVFVANDGGNTVNEIMAVNGVIPASPTVLTLGTGFLQPFDVAVDKSGNVYVADRGNNAVKEIVRAPANFGPVNVGTVSSTAISVPFTFDTAGTLGSTIVVAQGIAGVDFYDAGGGTCTANTAYAVLAVCTVNVKFAPLFPGQRYGSVELLSGTGALLATGPVQGIGVGPQTTFATTTSGVLLPTISLSLGSGFSSPASVAVDVSGNVFVADSFNNAVKKILAVGGWTTVNTVGSGFSYPNGVALDGSGNVYVADTFNDAIKEIVAVGGYTTIKSLGSGFSNPYGVAVDGNGNVYVADFANNAVKEIEAVDGSIPASPSIRTLASGLSWPDGVAVDGNGNVFVANYGDGTVLDVEAVNGVIPASPTIVTIASGLSGPSNLSVDAIGNVYVSDTGDSEIKEIVAAGGYSTIKTLGSGFNFPEAVAVDRYGDLFVADTDNNAIELLDYSDPPTLSFASTGVGQTSSDSPQTVTLGNVGNAPLILQLPVSGHNPNVSANFTWAPSSTCVQTAPGSSQPFDLAGGVSCTAAIDFKPTTIGAFSGNAALTDNNLNVPGSVQTIQLVGSALQSQTITFATPASQTYGTPLTLSATASSGLAVSYASTTPTICTVSGSTVTFVAGGAACSIQATQAGNSSYSAATAITRSFWVYKEAQTINFAAISSQKLGTPLALSATATSGLAVTFISTTTSVCTVSGATATFVATGTCTIDAHQAGNGGYLAAAMVAQSFSVTKAAQTITFATPANQTYGTPLTLSATASSGLAVSYASTTPTICTVSGSTVTFVAGGAGCSIQATQAGNSNYSAATAITRSFWVFKEAQTINFAAIPSQTVGTPLALSATASSGLAVTFTSTTTGVCTVSGTTATFVAAGTCTIDAHQAGNGDYLAATVVAQSFTVAAD
jgi:sugar lactone lactonase YvrE